jgi:hypothetical protein
MSIAAEVLAGLQEAGVATAGAALELTFTRPGTQVNPWDTAGTAITYNLFGVDMGIRQLYADGAATESTNRTSAVRRVRMLMVDATGTVPAIGDRVAIGAQTHDVLEVKPLAPGGVPLYFELEVST